MIKPLPRGDTLHRFLCQFQSLKNVANPLRAWQAVVGNVSMSREEASLRMGRKERLI